MPAIIEAMDGRGGAGNRLNRSRIEAGDVPLWSTNIAIENSHILVDLPIKNGNFQ